MDLDGLGCIWMDQDGFGWNWMDLDGLGWIRIYQNITWDHEQSIYPPVNSQVAMENGLERIDLSRL